MLFAHVLDLNSILSYSASSQRSRQGEDEDNTQRLNGVSSQFANPVINGFNVQPQGLTSEMQPQHPMQNHQLQSHGNMSVT